MGPHRLKQPGNKLLICKSAAPVTQLLQLLDRLQLCVCVNGDGHMHSCGLYVPDSLHPIAVLSKSGFTYEFRVPWSISIMPATARLGFKPTQQLRQHSAVVEATVSTCGGETAAAAGLKRNSMNQQRDQQL